MADDPPTFSAHDPATGEAIWQGRAADATDVDRAVQAARHASVEWQDIPLNRRIEYLQAFAAATQKRRGDLIDAICRSSGKPKWESATEVDAVIGKVALTIQAHAERQHPTEKTTAGTTSATRYKPHGVLAVFGPFNFPAHLPNGHIIPALLAGNSVIFKPSEQTPLVGEIYGSLWNDAALPLGGLALLQGGRETGAILANHPHIDGLLFTGSFQAGVALSHATVNHPEKILALEMGGNNPLIVHQISDTRAAAYWTIQSAFITAGQRCSCARRLILIDNAASQNFLNQLTEMTRTIRVGRFTESPEPFMGPVISPAAAQRILKAQSDLLHRGAKPLLEMKLLDNRAMLSPGIIDVTNTHRDDIEIFGPLLQVIRVKDFDAAITEANNTRYGLAASLFTGDRNLYETFFRKIRAGVVNWNRPTTGASGALPFGGIGRSGNHRPSGYFAIDYCAYPIASMESPLLSMPSSPTPGLF